MSMNAGRREGCIAEINVTPMADVMIVLLVIFMVFIAALGRQDALTLPRAANARERARGGGPLEVALRADARVLVDGHGVDDDAGLAPALRAALDARGEDQPGVRLSADRGLPYDRVDAVARTLREAGAGEVELVVDPLP